MRYCDYEGSRTQKIWLSHYVLIVGAGPGEGRAPAARAARRWARALRKPRGAPAPGARPAAGPGRALGPAAQHLDASWKEEESPCLRVAQCVIITILSTKYTPG